MQQTVPAGVPHPGGDAEVMADHRTSGNHIS